jgi:hypothetical protein
MSLPSPIQWYHFEPILNWWHSPFKGVSLIKWPGRGGETARLPGPETRWSDSIVNTTVSPRHSAISSRYVSGETQPYKCAYISSITAKYIPLCRSLICKNILARWYKIFTGKYWIHTLHHIKLLLTVQFEFEFEMARGRKWKGKESSFGPRGRKSLVSAFLKTDFLLRYTELGKNNSLMDHDSELLYTRTCSTQASCLDFRQVVYGGENIHIYSDLCIQPWPTGLYTAQCTRLLCLFVRLPTCFAAWLNSWLPGYLSCLTTWLNSCLSGWLRSCLATCLVAALSACCLIALLPSCLSAW